MSGSTPPPNDIPDSVADFDSSDLPETAPQSPHSLPAIKPVRAMRTPGQGRAPLDPTAAQLQAMTDALGVLFARVDQQAKLLETEFQLLQQERQEMMDTLKIMQELWGQWDEGLDKLARATAANIKMFQLQMAETQDNSLL